MSLLLHRSDSVLVLLASLQTGQTVDLRTIPPLLRNPVQPQEATMVPRNKSIALRKHKASVSSFQLHVRDLSQRSGRRAGNDLIKSKFR